MPALREVQAAFRDGLLAGDPAILGMIAGGRLSPAARLQIHRNNLFVSLGDALAAHYPVVQRLLGEACFAATARQFIAKAPPREPVLAAYGAGFADFLAGFPPVASLPWLSDTARLEWAIHQVRQSAPDASLSLAGLAAVAADALPGTRLTLQPGVRHLATPHAVDAIWHANQPDADGTVTLDEAGRALEIRALADGTIAIVALDSGRFAFRSRLAGGVALGVAADAALARDPQFDLALALHALFADALVTAITIPTVAATSEETSHDD